MSTPISFIVPAYRSSSTLEECLESILALHGLSPTSEIIVVLCRATEDERRIVSRVGGGITVIETNQRNRSLSRNLGAAVATGELLAFVDSDIRLDHDWLRTIRTVFDNKLVAACQGGFSLDAGCDSYTKQHGYLPSTGQSLGSPFGPVIVTGACVYRASVFDRIGRFDERVLWNEDLNLSVTAFGSGYAVAYEEQAAAFLLDRGSSMLSIAQRSFASGRGYFGLLDHKYPNVDFRRSVASLVRRRRSRSHRHGRGVSLPAVVAAAKLLTGNAARLGGFTMAYLFGPRAMYSFPLEFRPYLGFSDDASDAHKTKGLVYVNGKRFLLDFARRELVCIRS